MLQRLLRFSLLDPLIGLQPLHEVPREVKPNLALRVDDRDRRTVCVELHDVMAGGA
jgi:hypothetical protein